MKCRSQRVWLGMILASTLAACASAPPGDFSGAVTTNVGDGRIAARPVPGRPMGEPFDMHAQPGDSQAGAQ